MTITMPEKNMTINLQQIQPFIQAYVHAIAAILNAVVTVVDRDLVRIGGTSLYADRLGEQLTHAPFFQAVIRSGKPAALINAKIDNECTACEQKNNCPELADIAYPIYCENKVAGVIGIVAFNKTERDNLLKNRDKLEEALKYLSMLIESKLSTLQHSQVLENQLDEVIKINNEELQCGGFIGKNKKITELLEFARKVSNSDSTVLIRGESGTGKEVLAKFLHTCSDRRQKLMISINCGAIPEQLVESELFGYEGGAFTGANKHGHIGKFELADGSTLFLDEIGEMPLPVQTKLLRVLQERKVQRIGGKKSIPINVRILCATNQDLLELVEKRMFRLDLFYRLNVIPMNIPALRERKDDIPLFVAEFISRYNKKLRKQITGVSPEVLDVFCNYDWPGNVRDLKNIIEYLANIVEEGIVQLSDLPNHFFLHGKNPGTHRSLKALLSDQEKHILETMLHNASTAQDKKAVAERLGISLATLYRKITEHGIRDSHFQE